MDANNLILAILQEARSQGIGSMLRTTLVKYLYLLDVYSAEETQGTPVSGVEWQFLHFGPFSTAVAETLDDLAAQRILFADKRESKDGDKEFVLYSLTDKNVPNLRELGIAGRIQLHVQADIKRYGRDLPQLLDYVYFRTMPMADAQPGDILDFSHCSKIRLEDVRPVEMCRLRPKAIKTTRGKLRDLIEARKSREVVNQGPYDEVYYSALRQLDGVSLETGLVGKAKLKV